MKSGRSAPPEYDDDVDGSAADRWTVADLIDLEYYLGADETALREQPAARAALTERDRSLYLDQIGRAVAPAAPHTGDHRRLSLLHWLRARRAGEPPEQRLLLPGSTFAQAQRLITMALAVIGFLLGVGAASALLSYDGHRPININWYIFLLVVVQLLLIGGILIGWLVRRSRPVGRALRDLTLLGRLIRPLVARVSQWLQRQHLGARKPGGPGPVSGAGRSVAVSVRPVWPGVLPADADPGPGLWGRFQPRRGPDDHRTGVVHGPRLWLGVRTGFSAPKSSTTWPGPSPCPGAGCLARAPVIQPWTRWQVHASS